MSRDTSGLRRGNPVTVWPKGVSANPNGKISIKKDLERARLSGVPPEVAKTLDEWFLDADGRLAELGAQGFIAGLQQALADATARAIPVDTAEARAWWWRTVFPVFLAGPSGSKDSVWTYAAQEMGVRLMGKPKDTIALEDGGRTPIDWQRVPEEERPALLAALMRLQGYIQPPENDTEH